MADEKNYDEAELTYAALMQRYGDRLSPEMAGMLRSTVEAVLKTVNPVRAVPLANGDAPLLGFAPVRSEE
jgi:hypothetical protein